MDLHSWLIVVLCCSLFSLQVFVLASGCVCWQQVDCCFCVVLCASLFSLHVFVLAAGWLTCALTSLIVARGLGWLRRCGEFACSMWPQLASREFDAGRRFTREIFGQILSTFFVARFALGGHFCPSRALWAALQGTVPLSAKGTFRSQHRRHTAIPSSSAWHGSALKYHLHSSSDSSIFFDVHACCQQPCQPSHSITGPHHRFSHQTESATWYMKITTHLKC